MQNCSAPAVPGYEAMPGYEAVPGYEAETDLVERRLI